MEQFSLSKKPKAASPNSSEDEAEQDHIRSSARSSDSMAELDIMSLLDQGRLSQIKKDFKLFDNHAIPKQEFISIMMHHLPEVSDKLRMVGGLCELFEQVDVNHDQVLEWDEFSNYIIEQGMMNNDRTLIDAFKNYEPITDWRDESKHENDIEHMQYLPRLKHLLVMERKSKSFKVYNMRTGKFMKEVKGHRGPVISAAHAPELKYVATSDSSLLYSCFYNSYSSQYSTQFRRSYFLYWTQGSQPHSTHAKYSLHKLQHHIRISGCYMLHRTSCHLAYFWSILWRSNHSHPSPAHIHQSYIL